MSWTDDPIADFNYHERQQQAALDRLPRCSECGQPIQSDYFYEFENENICEECLKYNHRKNVEDFIE